MRPQCSIENSCVLDDAKLYDEDTCPKFPERAFSLWAMRNLARYIQRWNNILTTGVNMASLFTASIAETFCAHAPKDVDADPTSILTILSGFLTTFGAMGPQGSASATVFSIVGGIGVSNGIAGSIAAEDPIEDVRFTDFSKLQKTLGTLQMTVSKSMSNYYDRLFTITPPEDDWGRATELARLLESGAFASQDVGTGNNKTTAAGMGRLIQASIIAEAWNSQRVAIVKWSKDNDWATRDDYHFNPCFGGKRYGIDYTIACQFDKNYMIVSAPAILWKNNKKALGPKY